MSYNDPIVCAVGAIIILLIFLSVWNFFDWLLFRRTRRRSFRRRACR